ncbi:MAG: aldo/keto reductase [Planctomycetes bacterium]|nr:aldo/keto reductase [Planctomycetota bacterium]
MHRDDLSRREFVRSAALAAGAAALAGCAPAPPAVGEKPGSTAAPLPSRPLGRTGVTVPIIGMGTAPAGMHRRLDDAAALFKRAIDLGVTYMDAAPDFAGYGKAQAALGKVLERRRDEVFLVTKLWEPEAGAARKLLERNLKELRTDHADLVYAHSVGDDKMDPKVVQGKGGVLELLQEAKRAGLTRFAGISGHSRPWRFVEILERFPVDVVMCAVNFADRHTYDFEGRVFPEAVKRGAAVVAMKVFGGMRGSGSQALVPPEHSDLALRYALSLEGLSLAVVGMKDEAELEENVRRARAFEPLGAAERERLRELGKSLAAEWGAHFGPVA